MKRESRFFRPSPAFRLSHPQSLPPFIVNGLTGLFFPERQYFNKLLRARLLQVLPS
jgi:hypothetical protein